MKIKDILGKIDNVDVYDDFTEELGIAYCATTLTSAGAEKFADVLELDCNINGDVVIVEIDKLSEGEDERMLQLAIEMFEGMAGSCSENDYEKYFIEEVENV